MWPKALTTLIELVPHLTRLIPMADRFLSSKSAEQEASTLAMQQMADGLRGDLGQVTASHAGLYRQLNDQSEKLLELGIEIRESKAATDALSSRLTAIETQMQQDRKLFLGIGVTVGILVIAVLIVVLLRH